jgi:ferredoxin
VQMAEDHDFEMPVSCCSGACFVCACAIKEWAELVDIAKLSVPLVDIDEDQVLSCVGWVKPSAFSDGLYHRIVLQKLM